MLHNDLTSINHRNCFGQSRKKLKFSRCTLSFGKKFQLDHTFAQFFKGCVFFSYDRNECDLSIVKMVAKRRMKWLLTLSVDFVPIISVHVLSLWPFPFFIKSPR